MNKLLKGYAILALIIGLSYWYATQTPYLFPLLFGIGLLFRGVKSYIDKDKNGFYLNIACSITLIFFGVGLVVNNLV